MSLIARLGERLQPQNMATARFGSSGSSARAPTIQPLRQSVSSGSSKRIRSVGEPWADYSSLNGQAGFSISEASNGHSSAQSKRKAEEIQVLALYVNQSILMDHSVICFGAESKTRTEVLVLRLLI